MKGLVLEGGAHRGIYTAGVMDAFLENGIEFDGVIGVSAGAIHGASFVSRQIGRSVNYTAEYCGSRKYMGWGSFFTTGNYFNVRFCYYKIPSEKYPIDSKIFRENAAKMYVVCTDFDTAEPLYHECPELEVGGLHMKYLQASASMPVVSRPVKIDGKKYVDGGIADSVPEKQFRKMGYTKNVVVLTQEKRPAGNEFNAFVPLSQIFCPGHKKIVEALKSQYRRYQEDLEYLEQQEKEGNVFIIRPSYPPVAGVMERDGEKIRATHKQGYEDAVKVMDKLKEFLK